MTPAELLERLGEEAGVLGRAASSVNLDAEVPTCPEFRARDLIRHLGGIHRWAAAVVGEPRTEPWFPELEEVVGDWPPDAALSSWLDDGLRGLIDTLSRADADVDCFAPLPSPSPRAMWCRRQLHETTIHRVDLEISQGDQSEISAEVADDGIDELLAGFTSRAHSGLVGVDGEARYAVATTDTGEDWVLRSSPTGIETTRARTAEATQDQISGPAVNVYLFLWNRADADQLTSPGSGQFVKAWSRTIHPRYQSQT